MAFSTVTSTGPRMPRAGTFTVRELPSAATVMSELAVTEVLPSGLTLVSMKGDDYTCSGTTCVSSVPLRAVHPGKIPPLLTITRLLYLPSPADNSKARRELGWEPEPTVNAIRRAARFYADNQLA